MLLTLLLAAPAAAAAEPPATPGTVGGVRLGGTGVVVAPGRGGAVPPAVRAQSYVVADALTGEVLAAKGAHVRLPPASTVKTLTALTVHPKLDVGTVVVASRGDAAVEGSRAGLVPGGTYTVGDLYNGLFLRSGNDASTALARVAGGSGGIARTVADMAAQARQLGAWDTTVVNPTGLDEPGQLSSAYDLALFGRAALRVADLRPFMSQTSAAFPGAIPPPGQRRPTYQLWTQQRFVRHYPGAVGVKNGFTTKARYTMIAAAERDGRTVLVTLMRSHSGAWREAAALADWAFRHGARLRPVGHLVEPPPAAAVRPLPGAHPLPGPPVATAGPAASSGTPPPAVALAGACALAALAVGGFRARAVRRTRRRLAVR